MIIVDWENLTDPQNPKNWPLKYKIAIILQVCFLSCFVYLGSAIYTPGIDQIMLDLNISYVLAILPLTMFVIGYGIGPMIFSPMSENAVFGRTSIYIVTLFLYCVLQIPVALAKDITSLSILRFLCGIFASPALATGGASIADILYLPYMPHGLAIWGFSCFCGISLGPFFGSILVVKDGWRWTFWFSLILSGICLIVLSLFLPETYDKTILFRKAKILREITGNKNIISKGEIENNAHTKKELVVEILWRPFEVTLLEPVVLLINIYISMVYYVIYIWYEAFPIVFTQTYKFTLVQTGTAYFTIMVGSLLGAIAYLTIIYHTFTKYLLADKSVKPEIFLFSSIIGSVLMPLGIFVFGWTSRSDYHWVGPIFGAIIFGMSALLNFQSLLQYLGVSFPRYVASVFASNDMFRSVIAGCFPLFARPLFNNLSNSSYPVAWGCTVLGFISLLMILIPVLFYINGHKLRAKSKFSGL